MTPCGDPVDTPCQLSAARCITATARACVGDHARALRLTWRAVRAGIDRVHRVKAYEWSTEVDQSHTISSNNFFMFYYTLTGVHLFHLLLGLPILGVVARELRNPRRRRMFMVESGATYWHVVDLLWTIIFALLYVTRPANDHHRRTDDHLRVDHPVRDHHCFEMAGTG
jgi:heme/copper-type cytochrome/quinol oxidase subunit 3